MSTTGTPVILAGHALQSLRNSGYTIAAAFGEIVDNSIEANANNIRIRMDEVRRGKGGQPRVHRVVFADDGDGMADDTLQHYPQLGYSTRYMQTNTIGKFGVGATLAALNFGTRLDVWSRTQADDEWKRVYFDLVEATEAEKRGEQIVIAPPAPTAVPSDLADMFPQGSGTVVVWSNVDRLEEGQYAKNFDLLRVEVEKELSRIFRNFIAGGIKIEVNGVALLPHDPLFLMEGTWAEAVLTDYYTTGEGAQRDTVYGRDDFFAQVIADEEITIAGHVATVTVTLYPPAATRTRGLGRDALAKKLRIPDNEGAISFMRLNREISYTNVPRIFGRAVADRDRWVGIEVAFTPELDEYFGVRNVKRGAEPHDQLRAKIRGILTNALGTAQTKLDEQWGAAAKKSRTTQGEHGPIAKAAGAANQTMPKSRAHDEQDEKAALEKLTDDVLGTSAPTEEKEEYQKRIKELPFIVESVDFPGKSFIDVQHVAGKVIIRLNTRHRFYREMWEPLKRISNTDPAALDPADAVQAARRSVEALTLLLIAYGKAESMHDTPSQQYSELRDYWGIFSDSLIGKVKDVL